MKIFYLTDLLSPYRVEWMNSLSEKCDVFAFYFDEGEKTREEDWLHSIKNRFESRAVNNTAIAGVRFSNDVFDLLRSNEYDIYIIDGYASLIQIQAIRWLTKSNKKVFINVDGIDVWRKETLVSRIKGIVKSGIYKSGAKFLCGSQIAADRIVSLGAKKEDVFTHPFTSLHEADIISFEEKIKSQNTYKEKIGSPGKRVVVAVGRFIPLKQYDVLIKAWNEMPEDCVLYLIGGGELRGSYEALINDLNIKNIIILDYLNTDRLNEYYMAADLFVHTSATEAWGLVFNEAMAKGCPAISTNHCVGGVELIRNGEEGFIVKSGNVTELHERMLEILDDEELKKNMMRKAIERIKPYTFEQQASIHIDIFKEQMK